MVVSDKKEWNMFRDKRGSVDHALTLVAKPMCFPDFSGGGYLDLVVWGEDDILTEVVVYIDEDIEFRSLSVGDIILHSSCNLDGDAVEIGICNFKDKVLDLMDVHDIYSAYVEELNDKLGLYEPTATIIS